MGWETLWKYQTVDYVRIAAVLKNTDLHIRMRSSLRGNRIRIEFANTYGNEPLTFESVIVSNGTDKSTVLHQKRSRITINPGERFFSDAIESDIEPGDEVWIHLYIKDENRINAFASTWASKSWSVEYEQGAVEEIFPLMREEKVKPSILFGISQVQVQSKEEVQYLYMFGDSITHMSFYTDPVQEWISRNAKGKYSLINAGICGNRVLRDGIYGDRFWGKGREMGGAGIRRAGADIRERDHIAVAVVLEGINDILQPYQKNKQEEVVTPVELCKGLADIVNDLKRKSGRVYLGTITPFQKDGMTYAAQCEELRLECNRWIRSQNVSDGVIDFDRVIRNPECPAQISPELSMPDGVHPNAAGGRKMADEMIKVCLQGVVSSEKV